MNAAANYLGNRLQRNPVMSTTVKAELVRKWTAEKEGALDETCGRCGLGCRNKKTEAASRQVLECMYYLACS